MPTLPQFQDDDQPFQLMQNSWGAILNPIINYPPNLGNVLKNIVLANGTTVVNHKLGRKLQGWKIIRQRAAASIYDNQDSNSMADKTLLLISNAIVTVDLEVF